MKPRTPDCATVLGTSSVCEREGVAVSTSLGSTSLDGRVAVVTGAGGGLRPAEAIGLAERGATVIVNDLGSSLERSDVIDVVTAAGGRAVPVAGDISDSATATEIVRTAVDDLGSLDIVVNNAGITATRCCSTSPTRTGIWS